MLATIDLGTTATKVGLWHEAGVVASGRAELVTVHPEPGWAEQDPEGWWASVVEACRQLDGAGRVEALAFAAARQTFVPVDEWGEPIGRGLLWSDRRAGAEAAALASGAGGTEALRLRTGVVVDEGSTAAKVAWLWAHEPERLERARWLLSPRDLVVLRMTGAASTDTTLASRTGFYSVGGELVPETAGTVRGLLPPVAAPVAVAGELQREPARRLGLPEGLPVVLGAGDRACEVLGTGAAPNHPMVSWGTTANVSVPVGSPPDPLPAGLALSRGALDGHLLEAGISASGAALSWLGRLTGRPVLALAEAATASPPGANGVLAVPWFNGARAPWWRPGARAAFLNLAASHGPGDLARALYEGIAFDVARSLEAIGPPAGALSAAGGGAASTLWVELLAAVSRRTVMLRRSGEAASTGACLLAAEAVGAPLALEDINPVVARVEPSAALVEAYGRVRPRSDRAAAGALDLSEA